MDDPLFAFEIWRTLIYAVLVSGILTLIITILGYVVGLEPKPWSLLLFSLCLLSVTAGWLTGNSREPAIGAVVPAVLTFVGGLSAYIALQRTEKIASSPLIPALIGGCTLALAFPFLLGTLWGSVNRSQLNSPTAEFRRLEAEEHNRFRLELLRAENKKRLERLAK